MAKTRKGSMYEALLGIMGRPKKPTTKLKTPPKPKSGITGGGKSSGGGFPKAKSGGGKTSKMPKIGKGKSAGGKKAKGPSQKELNERGVKEAPEGSTISAEELNESPIDRKKRMRAEARQAARDARDKEAGEGETSGGSGSPTNATRSANSDEPQQWSPSISQAELDESPRDRQSRMRREAREARRNDQYKEESPAPTDNIPRARDRKRGSRGGKMVEEGAPAPRVTTRPEAPVSTEQELDMVQRQISTPRPEDIEILMSDPQKLIGRFIDAFGEENVPEEVWSMLEAPTGMPPDMPPNMPPTVTRTPYDMPMPMDMPPPMPKGDYMSAPPMRPPAPMPMRPPPPVDEDFLPDELRRPKMPY